MNWGAAKLNEWSGRWDSNPRLDLGKVPYYPYTTAAIWQDFLAKLYHAAFPATSCSTAQTDAKLRRVAQAIAILWPCPILCKIHDRGISSDLKNSSRPDHRGFSLPVRKPGGFLAVRIDPREPLAVFVEYGYLPVLVLSAPVLAECGAFPMRFRLGHG